MSNKKKILILVGMFALLVVTAVLNYTIASNANKKGDDAVATGNFFTNYRTERTTTRNQEIAYLDTIIVNESADYVDARNTAMEQKMKLISIMEMEVTLEHLIKAAGYDDVVVTIGSTSDNVNIIVTSQEALTNAQVASIYTLVFEETGIDPDFVRIIPV